MKKKGLFSQLKRKSRSNLIATSDYLKVSYKDDGSQAVPQAAADDKAKGTKCISWTLGTIFQ